MTRDPRKDPRPGTIIQKYVGKLTYRREVVQTTVTPKYDWVVYKTRTGHNACTLNAWNRWAEGAEVVSEPNNRDPLIDPMPGDAVIYGPQWQRDRVDVTAVIGEHVHGTMHAKGMLYSLRQWREWMVGAEVIHAAE